MVQEKITNGPHATHFEETKITWKWLGNTALILGIVAVDQAKFVNSQNREENSQINFVLSKMNISRKPINIVQQSNYSKTFYISRANPINELS